ncbi:MAG: Xaa-Pro aminopeptidase [Gammaproteobacteria bacterium]|nr:Xaa-Pro aminopeptidase [Gammaproteobacteria bacterium]
MKQSEFKRRRTELMKMMGKNTIAILPAASLLTRNRDADFPFRQDSDFLYLTGFNEPDAVMVLMPGRKHGEYILFCREKDEEQETWHGRRAGQEGAIEIYAADDSFPIDDIDDILPGLLEGTDKIFNIMGQYPEFDQRLIGWVNHIKAQSRAGVHVPSEFVSLDYVLHDIRLYKSREELKLMRRAASISARAHQQAMRICKPGLFEYQIAAEFDYEFRKSNAVHAYSAIVGGGANGCILHYTDNGDPLNDGDLLLIDAGCEVEGYASDITRTFPVNGKYSAAQREIYEIVLAAQKAGIRKVKPGNHWNDPHNAAVRAITRGLMEIKLLKGSLARLIKERAYRKFYMHRTGHWLGLDVHDVGDYKVGDQWRLLEPGMVLTIEPGIYIPAKSKGVRRKWWNIGIRIEDDVLVTRDGCEVLSAAVPKTIQDIEALMAG